MLKSSFLVLLTALASPASAEASSDFETAYNRLTFNEKISIQAELSLGFNQGVIPDYSGGIDGVFGGGTSSALSQAFFHFGDSFYIDSSRPHEEQFLEHILSSGAFWDLGCEGSICPHWKDFDSEVESLVKAVTSAKTTIATDHMESKNATSAYSEMYETCVANAEFLDARLIGATTTTAGSPGDWISNHWDNLNIKLSEVSPSMMPEQGRATLKTWQSPTPASIRKVCDSQARTFSKFINQRIVYAQHNEAWSRRSDFIAYRKTTELILPLSEIEKERLSGRPGQYDFMSVHVRLDENILCETPFENGSCQLAPTTRIGSKDISTFDNCEVSFRTAPDTRNYRNHYFDNYRFESREFAETNTFYNYGGRGYVTETLGVGRLNLFEESNGRMDLRGSYVVRVRPDYRGLFDLIKENSDAFAQDINWAEITSFLSSDAGDEIGVFDFVSEPVQARDVAVELNNTLCADALKAAQRTAAEK